MNVFCEYTMVKLESSGKYHNEVAVALGLPNLQDDNPFTLLCMSKNGHLPF